MPCCKERKYNLYLKSGDENVALMQIMRWDEYQYNSALSFVTSTGRFLLTQGTREDVSALSLKLALHKISHEIKDL